uniref:EF-hand calcium binding domain 3 n=1 Tax=Pseudonaja textilis TaxID=8673 RepID=A0A670YQ08_PSETE
FKSSILPPTFPLCIAFRTAYDTFRKDLDGIIDLAALETTAHNLGINLTEEEALDELIYADMDGKCINIIKENEGWLRFKKTEETLSDYKVNNGKSKWFNHLTYMSSSVFFNAHFVFFLVLLSISYYRQKFLDSTSKKVSGRTAKQGQHHPDKERLPRSQSSPITAFAGAARICIMNEKELESYSILTFDFVLLYLGKVNPSESPYNQIPIFPLIPNRDVLVKGKSTKDVQKLDMQRKMEPLSSFEDHFLRKKRWIKQIVSIQFHSAYFHLMIIILQVVKKVTGSYRKVMAFRERNKILKLWKRLRGGEIGLETDNPSFYQIFSTYTWSWNVLQELVSPRELQEYDKKQYQRVVRPATPVDKLINTSGKSKRSQK